MLLSPLLFFPWVQESSRTGCHCPRRLLPSRAGGGRGSQPRALTRTRRPRACPPEREDTFPGPLAASRWRTGNHSRARPRWGVSAAGSGGRTRLPRPTARRGPAPCTGRPGRRDARNRRPRTPVRPSRPALTLGQHRHVAEPTTPRAGPGTSWNEHTRWVDGSERRRRSLVTS